MKSIPYLLGLFSFLLSYVGWTQTSCSTPYEAIYEVNFREDSLNLDKLSTETLYLYTGKDCGIFMNYTEAHMDEIRADLERQLKETGAINIEKKYTSRFKKVFYKNLQTHKVVTKESIELKKFTYEENALSLQWEIFDETKTIQGFSAHKATTQFGGRDYIAWFTTEIPIPDGPYVFSGLPGLIIELYDTQDHYHFTLGQLNKLEEAKMFEFIQNTNIAKAEFQKLATKAAQQHEDRALQIGGANFRAHSMNDEARRNNANFRRLRREQQKHRNNPIELPTVQEI